jgi:hypothetical protein
MMRYAQSPAERVLEALLDALEINLDDTEFSIVVDELRAMTDDDGGLPNATLIVQTVEKVIGLGLDEDQHAVAVTVVDRQLSPLCECSACHDPEPEWDVAPDAHLEMMYEDRFAMDTTD